MALLDTFTPLIKSPAGILATTEGRAMLRPPPKMFAPVNKRDRTKYCEFHEDHDHDTNDCVDLRKEIEACVRKGRMAHLSRGAKIHNNNQDAYKGYQQICMAKEDEEKMSFHIEQGTFCYKKMPFGLKNIGATYQRLMDNMFTSQLGQFLGYMITNEGIQANPKKVQAIINMVSPRTLREVQALNGKIATLGRFLAKSAKRSLAFFKTPRGCLNKKDFQWTAEVEAAFQELKNHLQSLPALAVPKPSETLTLYLA
ncbi:hypothetical protein Tco_0194643 [Tanacetum coccineum]